MIPWYRDTLKRGPTAWAHRRLSPQVVSANGHYSDSYHPTNTRLEDTAEAPQTSTGACGLSQVQVSGARRAARRGR